MTNLPIPIYTIILSTIVSLPFAIYRTEARKSLFFKEWLISFWFVAWTYYLVIMLATIPFKYTNDTLIITLLFFVILVIAINQDYKKIPKQTNDESNALFFAVLGWLLLFALLSFSVYSTIILYNPTYFTTSSPQPTVPIDTPPECYEWTAITLYDVGNIMCVRGTVYQASYNKGMQAFLITFDEKDNSFFMVSPDAMFLNLNNQCVFARGAIKQFGTAPYLTVTDGSLYQCP